MNRLEELTKKIDSVTKEFAEEFGRLTSDKLNLKPSPDRWSIAEIMAHIITVNETYYPVIDEVRKGTYKYHFLARFGFMRKFFGKLILDGVQPSAKRKVKTFPIWEPKKSGISSDILNWFKASQEELKRFMLGCRDLVENNQVISSPANRVIVYNLKDVFEIIVAHEKRHLNQAREVLEQIKK